MKWMIKKIVVLALASIVMAGLMSGYPGKVEGAQEVKQSVPGSGGLSSVDSIEVVGDDSTAELLIKLSAPATFTSYKTTAPLRLVIDISQAFPGVNNFPLQVNKGNFKTVTASRYDTDAGILTRIDIELVKDVEAILLTSPKSPGELRVSFPSLRETSAGTGGGSSSIDAPVAVASKSDQSSNASQVKSPIDAAKQPIVDKHILSSISAKDNIITLMVDGGVAEYKSFRLSKPERLVVDLFDTTSSVANKIIPINAAGVASARLGLYPDKVRIVFDAVNNTFPETEILKNSEGVVVRLKNKEPDDENVNTRLITSSTDKVASSNSQNSPSAQATVPTADDKSTTASLKENNFSNITLPHKNSGPANIESIDFQVINSVSRIAIKVVGEVIAEPPGKSAGFVTLTFKNTTLPKSLQRSIETKGFISPVLRITPILVKTRKGTDTKIRVAMRVPSLFDFRQEADIFYIDFQNPEGLTAERISGALQENKVNTSQGAKYSSNRENDLTELAPEVSKANEGSKGFKGRKVTLEFADAEVRKIFQLLSEVSNKNFVLGDDVTGTISIKLVNVPWDQALDIILDTKNLDKREDGNIIIIKGKGKFKSQAEEEQEIKKALTKAIELKTETFSVNYADTAGIAAQFASLKTDRGTITQDVRTNKVIVKDIPQALDDMRRLIQQLDVPEKQVMIEARIVEATSTFSRNLGVNWGVHFRDGSASFLGINSLDTGFGGLTSAPPTAGTGTSAGGTMGISFGTLTSNIQLDMRLNAAASAGLIKIVSTPKVATLNNKTAKITQGQQIPYTSSTSDKVETKFIEAALALEVTPHINANGTIGMKIDAKNDSPGTASTGGAPPINKKQATTEMLLRDGETTVIGGIYVDSDTEADDGVPFLMDIPFLGKLFKTNSKSKTKTELLIFITPRILGTI
ncbi:MAG TPA: type IV pilus secretin PilQ [Stenomitos sp.]